MIYKALRFLHLQNVYIFQRFCSLLTAIKLDFFRNIVGVFLQTIPEHDLKIVAQEVIFFSAIPQILQKIVDLTLIYTERGKCFIYI